MIWEANAAKDLSHERVSPVNFVDYRGLGQVFEDAAAWWHPEINLTGDGREPIRVRAVETSANLFDLLGVRPIAGAGFPASPLHAPGRWEIVISHRLWQERFSGDRAIVGRTVQLNGRDFLVAGVMPRGFHYPADTDVWQRLNWDLARHSRGAHFMEAVARLRPGVGVGRAQAELDALTARLGREFPSTNEGWGTRTVLLHREIAGFFRPALFVLFGGVSLLLVIACANVANLLLARAAARRREVAVRAALGAARGRLVRQFLTESLLLAIAGTAAGIGIAFAGLRLLVATAPIEIPRLDQVAVDGRVLTFAAALSLATAVLFGLLPALFAASPLHDFQGALKDGGRTGDGVPARRARNLLIVAEVGLAVVLLTGAGLLVRTVSRLLAVDAGFDPSGIATVNVQLSGAAYRDWARVQALYAQLGDNLRAHPAIDSAGASNFLPLEAAWRLPLIIAGRPPAREGETPGIQHQTVDDGYFATLRVPLVRGRVFDERDTADRPGVVVINESVARTYWPGEDPVGRRIVISSGPNIGPLGRRLTPRGEYEIVGVVGDMRNTSLQSPPEPAIFHPQRQFPFMNMNLVLSGRVPSPELLAIVRDEVHRLDATVPVNTIRRMEDVLGEAVDQPRFLSMLMAAFAALALVLASVGIYGVLSFVIAQRRRELGIRMALGAGPRQVLWLVLRQGLGLAIAGTALGLAGGLAAGRALSTLLFEIRPTDPVTHVAVAATVLLAALAACLVPGRRATRLDPAAELRS